MQNSRASEGVAAEPRTEQPSGADEEQLRAEVRQLEDRYKRALADLDNYRKRSERETEWRVQEAQEASLRDWLEALDSVERAVRVAPDDPGLQAVLAQMESILARHGVTRLGAAGERFDPQFHQAVSLRASEELPAGTVVEVTQSGFAWRDKVLRPAHVVVSQHEPSG